MDLNNPEDYFSRVPRELRGKALLNLSYKNIIRNCTINKALANICKDPYFWKAKLQHDYPEEDIQDLEGPEYRAVYEKLLAKKYEKKFEKLSSFISINKDPRIAKINDQIKEALETHDISTSGMRIGNMLSKAKRIPKIKPLVEKRTEIYKHIEDEVRKYKHRAESLIIRYRKVFPIMYDPKYFHYFYAGSRLLNDIEDKVPKTIRVDPTKPLDRIGIDEDDLNKVLSPVIGEPVKDGFLIYLEPKDSEISEDDEEDNEEGEEEDNREYRNPNILIYVYPYNNHLYGELDLIRPDGKITYEDLPEKLKARIPENDVKRIYKNLDILD